MTINELVAKIERVKEEISNCEYSLGHIQTMTPVSYKEVFKSDWESKQVGGSVRDTSSERNNLERKLEKLRSELNSLEETLRWKEKELDNERSSKRILEGREKRRTEQDQLESDRLREEKDTIWKEKCAVWNTKSGLYRLFHMRKHPTKIYENLDTMSVEQISNLYR